MYADWKKKKQNNLQTNGNVLCMAPEQEKNEDRAGQSAHCCDITLG